jgi:hypothetical protein
MLLFAAGTHAILDPDPVPSYVPADCHDQALRTHTTGRNIPEAHPYIWTMAYALLRGPAGIRSRSRRNDLRAQRRPGLRAQPATYGLRWAMDVGHTTLASGKQLGFGQRCMDNL